MEAIPEEIQSVKPFLMRAEEMKVADPIVSYYTLRYALQSVLEYHKQNPTNERIKQYLINAMTTMEERRKELGEVAEPKQHYEKFVTILFVSADNDDRKVGATKATAQKFLILSYFIEAMSVFEELPPDWVEKRKYCKWKAADILKAIKKGEQPLPGGPNERGENQVALIPEEKKQEEPFPESVPAQFKPNLPVPETGPRINPYENQPRPNENPYKYVPPPPEPEKKNLPQPKIEPPKQNLEKPVPERRPAAKSSVLSKEHRAAIDLSKKFALNGVQELEYKNIQQARVAFENAIRALELFNSS